MTTKQSRRRFIRNSLAASAIVTTRPLYPLHNFTLQKNKIRLGGPVMSEFNSPEEWISRLQQLDYSAAYCPVQLSSSSSEISAYREAARNAGIIIAEVGAWSNPISPLEEVRNAAIDKCIRSLQLADEVGARCCVNISGSRSVEKWAGPHKDNLTEDTFNLVVETTRKIIDAVKPTNTYFTLEAMPWSFPHSCDAYLKLIKAIERDRFAVHLDPVNLVVSPEIYFRNGEMIRDCFAKLGPHIKSCHAKDIILDEEVYTPNLNEVRPGLGQLNYKVFLQELEKLGDVPLMMEHLKTSEDYRDAANYIRSIAGSQAIAI